MHIPNHNHERRLVIDRERSVRRTERTETLANALCSAIFTSLLSELGVTGLEVSELYALDSVLLASLQPIYALIFLFKYVDPSTNSQVPDAASTGAPKEDTSFYFAHQVINNACATLALLNAVMNIKATAGVQLGSDLETLKEFSLALDPSSRGWALGESEKIREGQHTDPSSCSPANSSPSSQRIRSF